MAAYFEISFEIRFSYNQEGTFSQFETAQFLSRYRPFSRWFWSRSTADSTWCHSAGISRHRRKKISRIFTDVQTQSLIGSRSQHFIESRAPSSQYLRKSSIQSFEKKIKVQNSKIGHCIYELNSYDMHVTVESTNVTTYIELISFYGFLLPILGFW